MVLLFSIFYKELLEIIYGCGDLFYDCDGCSYVDFVNNVCYVGYCYLYVVVVVFCQQGMFNINMCYLSLVRFDYFECLFEFLFEFLDMFFFVNLGSEVNDFVLCLVFMVIGICCNVCFEVVYYGYVVLMFEVGFYKYDVLGGVGIFEYVVKMLLLDIFCGFYCSVEFGVEFVVVCYVDDFVQRFGSEFVGVFIYELIFFCGGQILFLDGYLCSVYDVVCF